MKTLKMLVEVENSKIYVYSYDANDGLCASDTVLNLQSCQVSRFTRESPGFRADLQVSR